MLTKNIDQHPTLVRDSFLGTTDKLWLLAITRGVNSAVISNSVIKEVELGHIAAFFRGRQALGLYERMAPNTFIGAGGGPGPVANPEVGRHLDPQYWARKSHAKDSYNRDC